MNIQSDVHNFCKLKKNIKYLRYFSRFVGYLFFVQSAIVNCFFCLKFHRKKNSKILNATFKIGARKFLIF